MTPDILSQNESSPRAETSDYPEIRRYIAPSGVDTASGNCALFTFETSVVHAPQREGWRDGNKRMAELERAPERARALALARTRLAHTLHPAPTLAALRMKKGLSQTMLAASLIPPTTQARISRIEAGIDSPLHETVVRIAQALNEPLDVVSSAIMNSLGDRS
jgi:hypothetical protein